MSELLATLRKRIVAACISAASVIVLLQFLILPTFLDFATDLILLALIWVAGKAGDEKE